MNLHSAAVSDSSSRKVHVAVVFVPIFDVAAYAFSQLVLTGELRGFAYVALLGFGAVFIIAILTGLISYGAPSVFNVPAPASRTRHRAS